MNHAVSLTRLLVAMTLAAVLAALCLSLGLALVSLNGQSYTELALSDLIIMAIFFCFFTLPVATVFAFPVLWLWQHFGPIHPLIGIPLGAVCGLVGGYGLLLLTFIPEVNWVTAGGFGVSGAVSGLAVCWIMAQSNKA
jgi:hypothetical protein